MKLLDLDMDYFMDEITIGTPESSNQRLSEESYGNSVWSEKRVRDFLENNLGLSKSNKIRGRIVTGHNESLFFGKNLLKKEN